MLKKTKISTAVVLALGSLVAGTALAQQAPQRVEVTGSSIKRVDAEGPAPLTIVTRKDIERTGATSVAELVKSLSVLDVNDQGELTGNSPSGSGTNNLQIRGLSERNILVLLNGRRLPTNALTDGSGAGAAVDVNTIPLSAIDRIEVLKDGGSAVYGSDAVAGVVNFITRKNYSGVVARAGYGLSSRSDAEEKSAGIVAGFGDYDGKGFNVLAALDVFRRDPIMRTDRDITKSADWRAYDGVTDGRSGFHPNGNILNAAGTAVVGQLVPCPPEDLRGTTCRFDFNKSVLTSVNGADRWSGMLIGNLKLSQTRAFAEFVYSESKDIFEAQPAPGPFTDALGRQVNGRFMQVGPRTTDRKSTLLSTTLGFEGTFGSIDWDIALGQGTSKVRNNDKNYLADDLFNAALAAGTINPTSSTNPTAALDPLRLTPVRDGKSVIKFVNAKLSGSVMELAGGSLGYAVGASFTKESLSDIPDANQQAGNVFGSIPQAAVDAKRDLKAVFGELAIPLMKNLEAQVAVRYDQYTSAQGAVAGVRISGEDASRTSPKLAIKYRPSQMLMVRGSYAESFLAPSLKQLFGGEDEGAESTSDTDILCPAFGVPNVDCDNFPYRARTGSNPNLKPETGKTYNLGFVIEPVSMVSLGVDFWRIEKENEVNQPTVETAVSKGLFSRNARGEWVVQTNNLNVAASKSRGVDVDLQLRLGQTPMGRLTVTNSATYYESIKTQDEPGDAIKEYAGTFLKPRWRNTLTASLESGNWTTTAALRTTAGMRDTDQEFGSTAYNRARTVGTFEQLDLGVQYAGIKGLTLNGMVKNVFDRMPPFSQRGTTNQYGSLGFPYLYSPRGRYFQVAASYQFY